jgi:hypothetical protein
LFNCAVDSTEKKLVNYRLFAARGLLFIAAILPTAAFTKTEVDEACLARVIVQSLHHEDVEFSRPSANVVHVVVNRGSYKDEGPRVSGIDWVREILNSAKTPHDL